MVGVARGYKVKLVMPECVSLERRKMLEAFGAELILSAGCDGTDGAIRRVHKIYEENKNGHFMPNQFDNEANVNAHYETTGKELYEQTNGEVSVFVAGMGTTGTLMGAGKRDKGRHDRRDPSGPRRPLPQHGPVHFGMRKMPAVSLNPDDLRSKRGQVCTERPWTLISVPWTLHPGSCPLYPFFPCLNDLA